MLLQLVFFGDFKSFFFTCVHRRRTPRALGLPLSGGGATHGRLLLSAVLVLGPWPVPGPMSERLFVGALG